MTEKNTPADWLEAVADELDRLEAGSTALMICPDARLVVLEAAVEYTGGQMLRGEDGPAQVLSAARSLEYGPVAGALFVQAAWLAQDPARGAWIADALGLAALGRSTRTGTPQTSVVVVAGGGDKDAVVRAHLLKNEIGRGEQQLCVRDPFREVHRGAAAARGRA